MKLKKDRTAWEGSQIRTAGGQLVTRSKICTARVTINSRIYQASFVVLQYCSRNVILGMDFLSLHGAVIDLRTKFITLFTDKSLPPHTSSGRYTLNVMEDQGAIPPLSSVSICVGIKESTDMQGIVECDQHLLINHNICVARRIAELRRVNTKVMLTNFSKEYKHVSKGTTVVCIEEILKASKAFALTDSAKSTPTTEPFQPAFNVNPGLPTHKQDQLKNLLLKYKNWFSSSSRIQQTPVAKYQIVMEENARSLLQSR